MEDLFKQLGVSESVILLIVLSLAALKAVLKAAPVLAPKIANSDRAKKTMEWWEAFLTLVASVGLLVLFAFLVEGSWWVLFSVVGVLLLLLAAYTAFLRFAAGRQNI